MPWDFLYDCAILGHKRLLRWAVKSGAPAHEVLLVLAMDNGHARLARWLLDQIDPLAIKRGIRHYFTLAMRLGDDSMVAKVKEIGWSDKAVSEPYRGVLDEFACAAARGGHPSLIKLVKSIGRPANWSFSDKDFVESLHSEFIIGGHYEMAKSFFSWDEVFRDGHFPCSAYAVGSFFGAVASGDLKIIKEILYKYNFEEEFEADAESLIEELVGIRGFVQNLDVFSFFHGTFPERFQSPKIKDQMLLMICEYPKLEVLTYYMELQKEEARNPYFNKILSLDKDRYSSRRFIESPYRLEDDFEERFLCIEFLVRDCGVRFRSSSLLSAASWASYSQFMFIRENSIGQVFDEATTVLRYSMATRYHIDLDIVKHYSADLPKALSQSGGFHALFAPNNLELLELIWPSTTLAKDIFGNYPDHFLMDLCELFAKQSMKERAPFFAVDNVRQMMSSHRRNRYYNFLEILRRFHRRGVNFNLRTVTILQSIEHPYFQKELEKMIFA